MRSILLGKLCENIYGKIIWTIENKETYREFKTMQEAEKWGMKYYKDWADAYQNTMRQAKSTVKDPLFDATIECYCGYMYKTINNYLRNEIDNENNFYREMTDIMTIVLCSAPRIPENIVLYRLVDNEFVNELIERNKETKHTPIKENGFMSTSLLKDIVYVDESYACYNNLLKIYVESGTMGVYVNAITRRREEEILLFSGMYLGLANYPYRDESISKMVYECKLFNFKF